MKTTPPTPLNGTYAVPDPEHCRPALELLADLTRRMTEFAETARKFDSTPVMLGNYALNLNDYEVSDNPYIPTGHYVLVRRRLDVLALTMPAVAPDLIIIAPRFEGGVTVSFVTQPRLRFGQVGGSSFYVGWLERARASVEQPRDDGGRTPGALINMPTSMPPGDLP